MNPPKTHFAHLFDLTKEMRNAFIDYMKINNIEISKKRKNEIILNYKREYETFKSACEESATLKNIQHGYDSYECKFSVALDGGIVKGKIKEFEEYFEY